MGQASICTAVFGRKFVVYEVLFLAKIGVEIKQNRKKPTKNFARD